MKIDQTFVGSAILEHDGSTIVAAVARPAHDLGLTVIAEGVETKQECEAIQQVGCDLAQGFYFAPALEPIELESMFEANQDRPVSLSLRDKHQPEVLRPLQRATRQGSRKGAAANGRCASSTPM